MMSQPSNTNDTGNKLPSRSTSIEQRSTRFYDKRHIEIGETDANGNMFGAKPGRTSRLPASTVTLHRETLDCDWELVCFNAFGHDWRKTDGNDGEFDSLAVITVKDKLPSPAASTAEIRFTHCNVCRSPLESHGDCSNPDCDTHKLFFIRCNGDGSWLKDAPAGIYTLDKRDAVTVDFDLGRSLGASTDEDSIYQMVPFKPALPPCPVCNRRVRKPDGSCANCGHHIEGFVLTLAHGPNTDIEGGYWQEPTSPKLVTLEVSNLRDAQTSFVAWRDANGLGSGNMTKRSGIIRRKSDGRLVGRFSYNGRFWNPKGKEVVISCAS